MNDPRGASGQSTVELVALLPLIAALTIGAWQAVVIGQSWWLAGVAARAAQRAQIVGRDPQRAARRALPPGARGRLVVLSGTSGSLTVRLAVPSVVGQISLGSATARVRLPRAGR
ncbi:MAG: pilus assembly protein [Actinomycetes bacterium]